MKTLKSKENPNNLYAIIDLHCPKCYPHKECGFVDGGLVHDEDVVEFKHNTCGYSWIENITLDPIKTKEKLHLKHLMFNDCHFVASNGMNHNAMDRVTVFEGWYDDINSNKFDYLYQKSYEKYEKIKNKETLFYNLSDIEKYATEHSNNYSAYKQYKKTGISNFNHVEIPDSYSSFDPTEFQ